MSRYRGSMHFTRPRDLLIAGVLGLAAGYGLFEAAYGALPPLPTLAGITLLLLAIVEVVLAVGIRGRIRHGRVVHDGVGVARAVVLAKASSMLGSVMLGGWLGVLVYLAPRLDRLAAARGDLPSVLVGIGCAAALIAAALWLEHCCRDPYSEQQQRSQRGERSP